MKQSEEEFELQRCAMKSLGKAPPQGERAKLALGDSLGRAPVDRERALPPVDREMLASGFRAGSYTYDKLLGEGSYGAVYQGTHVPSGRLVAIKQFLDPEAGDAEQEVAVYAMLADQPFPGPWLRMHEVVRHEPSCFTALVLDWVAEGSLRRALKQHAAPLCHDDVMAIACQVGLAWPSCIPATSCISTSKQKTSFGEGLSAALGSATLACRRRRARPLLAMRCMPQAV